MKRLADQDHYEVLDVPRAASWGDIRRAYDLARQTYTGDAPAAFPLFSAEERAHLFSRIEEAYRTLGDVQKRRAYDATLAERAPDGVSASPTPDRATPESESLRIGEVTGERLRQIRQQRGVSLDEIAERTRVNVDYLLFIEEEKMAALPAEIYLRGYLAQYAATLRLDAASVTQGYLTRFRAWQEQRAGI